MENIIEGPERIVLTPSNCSLGQFMYDELKANGDQTALICSLTGKSITYAELLDQSLRLASAFQKLGLKEGDSIGFVSENNLDSYVVFHATFFIGGTIAPINPTYVERELEHCMSISRPRLVIGSPLVIARVAPVVQQMVSDGTLDKDTVTLLMGEGPCSIPGIQTTHDVASEVTSVEGLPVAVSDPADKVSFIMCSSGTTGLPKGVELTNRNVIASTVCLKDPYVCGFTENDTVSGLLPFFHIYGLVMGLGALSIGSKFVIFPKFDPALFLTAIQKFKISYLLVVPPVVVFLGKHPIVDKFDLSSLREIWCGAAALSKEAQEAVSKRLGLDVIRQGYGLTETTSMVLMNPLNCNKYGALGVIVPGMKCKVIDIENGKILGPNETGELCFFGDQVMKGYRDNEESTKATIDEEGWMHSGDIGYVDEDGYIFMIDRLKELIKYKGFQVAPAELEALLLTHPAVQDAAVIGVPDEKAGELPRAFVVRQQGAVVTEQEIADFIADQVSESKRLYGGVKFVSAIPKSASGKILRRELRELPPA